jgi:hypothetical protein
VALRVDDFANIDTATVAVDPYYLHGFPTELRGCKCLMLQSNARQGSLRAGTPAPA